MRAAAIDLNASRCESIPLSGVGEPSRTRIGTRRSLRPDAGSGRLRRLGKGAHLQLPYLYNSTSPFPEEPVPMDPSRPKGLQARRRSARLSVLHLYPSALGAIHDEFDERPRI